jgi:hypothetical protein
MVVKFSKTTLTAFGFFKILTIPLLCLQCGQYKHIPEALETITAKDGTVWERVSEPGFGNDENMAVVAMEEYKLNRLLLGQPKDLCPTQTSNNRIGSFTS